MTNRIGLLASAESLFVGGGSPTKAWLGGLFLCVSSTLSQALKKKSDRANNAILEQVRMVIGQSVERVKIIVRCY